MGDELTGLDEEPPALLEVELVLLEEVPVFLDLDEDEI